MTQLVPFFADVENLTVSFSSTLKCNKNETDMRTRVGKIARLPKKIREELNRRLEDGCTGVKLTEWLNGLPGVQKVLREQFNHEPISEQNLSRWKEGGFQDWLRHQEARDQVRWTLERSDELEKDEGDFPFCETIARIMSVELAQHVQRLGEMEDPEKRWNLLSKISQELWRLRNATSFSHSVGLSWKKWHREVDQEEEALKQEQQKQQAERRESQEEYLERMMNLLHRPDLREWVRTDWSNREAEMQRLREIYHLPRDSKNTPFHPSQHSAEGARRGAVYNYPGETK